MYNLIPQWIMPKGMQTMDGGLSATVNTNNPNPASVAANVPNMNGPGPVPMPSPYSTLTPEQIAAARNWINQQYGTTTENYDAAGNALTQQQIMQNPGLVAGSREVSTPWNFNGDFGAGWGSNPGNYLPMARDIFGAAQAQGYDSNALADILGYTPQQISQFQNSYFGDQMPNIDGYQNRDVNRASVQFALDNGLTTRDAMNEYRADNGTGFGYSPDGFTQALRTNFGTSLDAFGEGGANGDRRNVNRPGGMGGNGGPGANAQVMPPPGGFAGGPTGYNFSNPTLNTSYTPSPYLQNQISQVGDQISRQFNEQIMPGLRSDAISNGTYGGAKQGVAEGIAGRGASEAFNNASMNLLGQDYTNAMNRQLQQYGMDQGYDINRGGLFNQWNLGQGNLALGNKQADNAYNLGLGQLGLGYYNAGNQYNLGNQGQMLDFYTAQRGQDLQQWGLGANIYNMGTNGMWGPINNANNAYTPWSGFGTQTNNVGGGGGWMGALGGALGAGQFGKNMGWWGA